VYCRGIELFKRVILILIFIANHFAFAALGDHENVMNSDLIKLKSSHHIVQKTARYSIHEIETPISTIREYVDNNGLVFAVSWRGIRRPDLSVLLGPYFPEYQNIDARRGRMITREPVSIQTSKIVVRKGGHMRNIKGLAIISDQLPSGVSEEDLK
jgi:hypothetical protein